MGCVNSKLNESISKGEEEFKYRGFAGPNHLVCLTSTTYGVFNNSCNRESRSSPVEATEVVETINAWELMDGLEDESPGSSPAAVEKGYDKVGSLKRSVTDDVLGKNRIGKSLGGSASSSPMGEKKLGLDKENERPKQAFGLANPNGVGPVAPLKERNLVGKENFGQYNNVGSVELAPDIAGSTSTAAFDEPLHKGRISCDVFWDCVGKENFRPSANGYSVPIGGLACKSVDSGTSPHYSEYSSHRAKGRISHGPLTELRIESSRHFDFCDGSLKDCSPLFDPEMLASFETSLDNFEEDILDDANSRSVLKKRDPWEGYEEKCPPAGQDSVILYTTTLRGIRKTFEDCNNVRCVLESYGICFIERDVSMHLLFRNELEKLMGRIVPVPRLFIKGRYIGSAGEVLELHEEGKLGDLLEGIPADNAQGRACDGCGGVRFVPCLECSGSCKLLDEEDNTMIRCPDCNENGLIQCPICC